MKALTTLFAMLMMVFGATAHADYYYTPATESGTRTGMNIASTGIAIAVIAGFIAAVATNSDGSSSHSHNS